MTHKSSRTKGAEEGIGNVGACARCAKEGLGFQYVGLLIEPPRLESSTTTDIAENEREAHSCVRGTREIMRDF